MSRFIAIVALAAANTLFAGGDRYPGSGVSRSADGDWIVSYVPANGGESHGLLLVDAHASKQRRVPLFGFNRSCDVLWAPDSRRLALTDWGGSDFAEITIAQVGESPVIQALDVSNVCRKMTSEEVHGHCYFEAVHWVDSDHLQIRVFGHADEPPLHGFEYSFVVQIHSGAAILLNKVIQSK